MDGEEADPWSVTVDGIDRAAVMEGCTGPAVAGEPGGWVDAIGGSWPDAVEVAPGVLSLGAAVSAATGRGCPAPAGAAGGPRPDPAPGDGPLGSAAAPVGPKGEDRTGEGRRRARRRWRSPDVSPARVVLAAAVAGLVAVAAVAVGHDAAARTSRATVAAPTGVAWAVEEPNPGATASLPGPAGGPPASSAPDSPAPDSSAPSPSATSRGESEGPAAGTAMPGEWAAVVRVLDERRAAAFARADPTAVGSYALPGSLAFDADVALLEELAAGHKRAIGVSTRLVSVNRDDSLAPAHAVPAPTGGAPVDRVRLAVVDERSAYELVADSGQSRTVQASGPRQWLITLEHGSGEDEDGIAWRLVRVDPGR